MNVIPDLRKMADSPAYAVRRGVLLVAAGYIEQLQAENDKLKEFEIFAGICV